MLRFVVIDSSPLIGLAIVDGLEWLPKLFGDIFLPESIKQEVLPGKAACGEGAIAHAIEEGWIKLWTEPIEALLDIDLDAGETDCINIGMSHANEVLLIIDERAGRAVAKEKKQSLISSARELFEVLHASDFRISAVVINQVLRNVNE